MKKYTLLLIIVAYLFAPAYGQIEIGDGGHNVYFKSGTPIDLRDTSDYAKILIFADSTEDVEYRYSDYVYKEHRDGGSMMNGTRDTIFTYDHIGYLWQDACDSVNKYRNKLLNNKRRHNKNSKYYGKLQYFIGLEELLFHLLYPDMITPTGDFNLIIE